MGQQVCSCCSLEKQPKGPPPPAPAPATLSRPIAFRDVPEPPKPVLSEMNRFHEEQIESHPQASFAPPPMDSTPTFAAQQDDSQHAPASSSRRSSKNHGNAPPALGPKPNPDRRQSIGSNHGGSKPEDKEAPKEPKEEAKEAEAVAVVPDLQALPATLRDFAQGLTGNGMSINIVLHNGNVLPCTMKYQQTNGLCSLVIQNNGKTRTVHLKDVPVLLISADDKQRIETKADIVRDDRCIGLVSSATGSCIPLKFEDVAQRDLFAEFFDKHWQTDA